jgi:uncharacterized protein YlxW (UPF0749 family)
LEIPFLIAALTFGVIAWVQSFRAYDAKQMQESSERQQERSERRLIELQGELRRVEKEHTRLVQKVINLVEEED